MLNNTNINNDDYYNDSLKKLEVKYNNHCNNDYYNDRIKRLEATYNNVNPKIYIGYWRDNFISFTDNRPYPISNFITLNQTNIIIESKRILNKYGFLDIYFSYSKCKLCNYKEGFIEYKIIYDDITYVIPNEYFHYLENHNIKIDKKLVEIVNFYSTLESN